MRENRLLWKFAVLHKPPYPSCVKRGPSEKIRKILVPVFEEIGVDIVFSGHNHMYERTYPIFENKVSHTCSGGIYITTGAGGKSLYQSLPKDKRPNFSAVVVDDEYSFTEVAISMNSLQFRQIAKDGKISDSYRQEKKLR